MNSKVFEIGGYRYVPGVFQYSGGVAALDGMEIVRARFRRPPDLESGFKEIEAYLRFVDRPIESLCACELRSPEPFSESAFREFNEKYAEHLSQAGIVKDGVNPVARTNVCPELNAPLRPEFYAFSYTTRARSSSQTFVVAGSGEAPEGKPNYKDHIVRPGDTTLEGLRVKADYVLDVMEARMSALDVGWKSATATQVYTVHNVYPLMGLLEGRGALSFGATWHYSRPPVVGLDFEMDCRGIVREYVL